MQKKKTDKERRFSSKELRQRIDQHILEADTNPYPGAANYVQRELLLAQAKQNKLGSRTQKLFMWTSFGLSVIIITLAVTTSMLAKRTMSFAEKGVLSDKAWKDSQIELLEEQIRVNEELNEHILKLLEKTEETDGPDIK